MSLNAVAIVKKHIDNDPLAEPSTEELAALAGINRNLLLKVFRETYKKRVKEYQVEKILEFSCNLLQEGKMSIKQIARKCGYKDQSSYSHAFKKKYNLSPTDWQNLMEDRNNNNLAF